MGYRTYLGKVSRKEYEKYHNMSYKKLKKSIGEVYGDGSVGIHWESLKSYEEIAEIIIYKEREVLYNHTKNFFENYTNEDTNFKVTDGKPFLEAIIKDNRETLIKWYKRTAQEKNENNLENLIYNFNLNYLEIGNKVSDSKYLLMDVTSREYMHFNYIHLLKTFDFKKEVLVYIGY